MELAWPLIAFLILGLVGWGCRALNGFGRVIGTGLAALMAGAFLYLILTGQFMASTPGGVAESEGCGTPLSC